MTHVFVPYERYGPLVFGMSARQIAEVMGEPAWHKSVWELHGYLLDTSLYDRQYLRDFKRRMLMSWPDSETSNKRPGVGLFDGRLVDIHLAYRRDRMVIGGVDVLGADRVKVILDLARNEEVVLFSGADYYFESVGIRVTAPRRWKETGSISLFSKEGFELEMNNSHPVEYHPE